LLAQACVDLAQLLIQFFGLCLALPCGFQNGQHTKLQLSKSFSTKAAFQQLEKHANGIHDETLIVSNTHLHVFVGASLR
jgi:hypothetical protein